MKVNIYNLIIPYFFKEEDSLDGGEVGDGGGHQGVMFIGRFLFLYHILHKLTTSFRDHSNFT